MSDDLIAQLETAREGSRELDRAIHLIVFADFIKERGMVEDGDGWRDPKYGKIAPPQPYTTSLDAAMLLVNGKWWNVGPGKTRDDEPLYGAAIYEPIVGEPQLIASGEHDTSATLALCIAALKARSA